MVDQPKQWQDACAYLLSDMPYDREAVQEATQIMRNEIERLRFKPVEGSPLDRLEWVVGTVASGEIDDEARFTIGDAIFGGMAEIRRLQLELDESLADASSNCERTIATKNVDTKAVAAHTVNGSTAWNAHGQKGQ